MSKFEHTIASEVIDAEKRLALQDEARAVRDEIAKLVETVKEAERLASERAANSLLEAAQEELQALGFTVRRGPHEMEAVYAGHVAYDFSISANQMEISKRQLPTEPFVLTYRFRNSPSIRRTPTAENELAFDEASLEEARQELRYWKRLSEELPKASPTYVADWPDRRHIEFENPDQVLDFISRDSWSSLV